MPDEALTHRIDCFLDNLRAATMAKLEEAQAPPASRQLFQTMGKLLRPRVLFLCAAHCESAGEHPNWDDCLDAALALEFIHVGTLYHDDIVDRSMTRRGQPALHRLEGDRAAALAGSQLIALGNQVAASLPDRLVAYWGTASVRMAEGQLRDTEHSGTFDRSIREFLANARRKTASGFELAAFFGSELGGAKPSESEALVEFGRKLGTAFQLADDLADFMTHPDAERQPSNDLRERTYTLPVLIACALEGEHGAKFRELCEDDGLPLSRQQASEIRSLLFSSGAFAEAARILDEEFTTAATLLGRVERTPAIDALGHLLDTHCNPRQFLDRAMQASKVEP